MGQSSLYLTFASMLKVGEFTYCCLVKQSYGNMVKKIALNSANEYRNQQFFHLSNILHKVVALFYGRIIPSNNVK